MNDLTSLAVTNRFFLAAARAYFDHKFPSPTIEIHDPYWTGRDGIILENRTVSIYNYETVMRMLFIYGDQMPTLLIEYDRKFTSQ